MWRDVISGLNPEQAAVVAHQEGALLVPSTAGSGKTHAVTVRIGRMVRDGVPPSRILAVTFSRKAAEEMTHRAQRYAEHRGMQVGTFHSLAWQIVRAELPEMDRWTVGDDAGAYRFCIKDAVGFRGMQWKDADISFLEQWIGYAKNSLATVSSDLARELAEKAHRTQLGKSTQPALVLEAYARTEDLRKERQILTFDDMLVEAARLLAIPYIQERWSSRYDYVIQDECQDQCAGMMSMAESLARRHRNYMAVGDINQAIYAWRGAHPEMMLQFEKTWEAKVIHMVRNYRSGTRIIATANRVIQAMRPEVRMELTMVAECAHAGSVSSVLYEDYDDEADGITRTMQELRTDGVPWSDMVVLYRVNAQSRAPEEALLSKHIPYRILGGVNFYERREVKDLLSYLRVAEKGRLMDVNRCINTPNRFLGKKFLERVEARVPHGEGASVDWVSLVQTVSDEAGVHAGQRAAAVEWARLIQNLRRQLAMGGPDSKPSRVLDLLLMDTKYIQWLVQSEGQETTENNRVSNVRELVRAADRFQSVPELLKYIDLAIEGSRRNSGVQPNAVTLMSVHRSKGLEHPVVFLVGCNENVLPHIRGDLDEERRLFYVGVTRAKDRLCVSAVRTAATARGVLDILPSRFLAEAGIPAKEEVRRVSAAPIPQLDDPANEHPF